jgi:hypothetical protein
MSKVTIYSPSFDTDSSGNPLIDTKRKPSRFAKVLLWTPLLLLVCVLFTAACSGKLASISHSRLELVPYQLYKGHVTKAFPLLPVL